MKKYENGEYLEMTPEEIAEVSNIPQQDNDITQLDIIEQLTDMDARLCQLEINTAEVNINDI